MHSQYFFKRKVSDPKENGAVVHRGSTSPVDTRLKQKSYLVCTLLKIICLTFSLYPKKFHFHFHVGQSADTIKGLRRRPLDRQWMTQITFPKLISFQRRWNRRTIHTYRTLLSPLNLPIVRHEWISECPLRECTKKICTGENDPYSRRCLTLPFLIS